MRNTKKGFTLVEIMIVVVIIGLLAAMAIPAFQKVRQSSQEKAVTNNLRQISSALDQYFLESGATEAAYADIVGEGKYITNIAPAAGEDYDADMTPAWPIPYSYTQLTVDVPTLDDDPIFSK